MKQDEILDKNDNNLIWIMTLLNDSCLLNGNYDPDSGQEITLASLASE